MLRCCSNPEFNQISFDILHEQERAQQALNILGNWSTAEMVNIKP